MSKSNYLQKKTKLDKAFVRIYREDALLIQDKKCCYCFEKLNYKTVTAEHIVPRSKSGSDGRENIAASCRACNEAKGNRSDSSFKKILKNFPSGMSWQIIMTWNRRKINLYLDRMEKHVMKVCK